MKIYSNISKGFFPIVITLLLLPFTGLAQQNETELNELRQLQKDLKKDYFSLGLLIQGLADFQPERVSGHNGFSASKARFKVSGIFDNRFGYKLQATILKSPAIIDANIFYKLSPNFSVKAGLFKTPFAYEYLISSSSILFAGRSTVVNRLAPKRQIGLQIEGFALDNFLRYAVGVFNGNNFGNNRNDDGNFLYVGQIEANLTNSSDNKTKLGINISYEQKSVPSATGNIQSTFKGEQTLAGSYFHSSTEKLLVEAEFIYSWLKTLGRELNPYGYYATVGYFINPKSRLLLRWDAFTGDNLTTDSRSIIAGFNYSPSFFTKLKLNYILPVDQPSKYSQILAVVQISF